MFLRAVQIGKEFLSLLPIVGPYFDWRFSQSEKLNITQAPLEEPIQTHADWASKRITPHLRVVFPDEVRDQHIEILKIQKIAEKLGVDSRDLEHKIFELKRGKKRLVVIPQKVKGIKAPVFKTGIDLHEIAEELGGLVNPTQKKEFFTIDEINVERQFKMFDSIASALSQELGLVIHEYEIGLRRSERPFDNGGVGVFIFQDEPGLKRFRIGTFRVSPRFQVVGIG